MREGEVHSSIYIYSYAVVLLRRREKDPLCAHYAVRKVSRVGRDGRSMKQKLFVVERERAAREIRAITNICLVDLVARKVSSYRLVEAIEHSLVLFKRAK